MDVFIMLFLIIGIVLVSVSWLRADLQCPPPKVIYRYVPKHTLDIQFSEDDNLPSKIFADLFEKSSPWLGGYDIGSGKTYTVEKTPK